jgi:HTH-type transcriptional regulator / antitoxin HigA
MTTGLKAPSNDYLQLINAFPPRPITNEAELVATQQQINLVLDRAGHPHQNWREEKRTIR